jgi:ankyrin repeat protein
MNGYRLDRRRDAMRISDGGTIIGPGNSAGSRLYLRITGAGYGAAMPPTGRLEPAEIETVRRWIDEGAEWPEAVSGDETPTTPDSRAVRLMDAIRVGDRARFDALLAADPGAASLKGAAGSTPLMFAALYGDVEMVKRLLSAGADPATRNDAAVTALMWGVDDEEKVRVLLDSPGTDINARSREGHTALTAAGRYGTPDVVALLLDRGATPAGSTPGSPTLLTIPVSQSVVTMLTARKPAVQNLAALFRYAVIGGCRSCADALIPAAAPAALNTALVDAARFGDVEAVRLLLARGADANVRGANGLARGFTPLQLAAAAERVPVDAVNALIAAGADVHAAGRNGETALDLAMLQGQTAMVRRLTDAGVERGRRDESTGSVQAAPAPTARAAVERSIPLIQKSDATFLQKAGCVSCHNNSIAEMALAAARERGLRIDEGVERGQLQMIAAYAERHQELFLGGRSVPGDYSPIAYLLAGFAAEHRQADVTTDLMARLLKGSQKPDGHWRETNSRPPIESSPVAMTALAVRALRAYAPPTRRAAYESSVQRAADWLSSVAPLGTEDRAYQLLGLQWAGRRRDATRQLARMLAGEQRADGGWGQLASLSSDAYATGEALVALTEAGAVRTNDPVYLRGMRYLLSTQYADGSWHVRTRTLPLQPYFDAGFPWGRDQFISAAATSWAVMALAPAVK